MLRSLSRQTRLFSLRNLNQRWYNVKVPHGLSVLDKTKVNDIACNWACKNDNKEIFKMTLLNSSPTTDISPVLFMAIRDRDLNTIKSILNDPRINNYKGLKSILSDHSIRHYTCENDFIEVVKILLADQRIDPSYAENHLLRTSIYHGHEKIVELLLNDPRVDPTIDNNHAFVYACAQGKTLIVKLFLNDKRINPWVNDNAAMKAACIKNHPDVLKLLLKRANEQN